MAVAKPVLVVIDPTVDADGFTTQLGQVDDYVAYGIDVVSGYVDTKAYFDEMLNDGTYLNDLQDYEDRILTYYNDAYSVNETMVTDGILNNLSAKEMEELTIPLVNNVIYSEHHTQMLTYYAEFRGDKTNAEVYHEIKDYLTPLVQGISRILAQSASDVFLTGTDANTALTAWADNYKNILINEISNSIDLGAKITTAQNLDTALTTEITNGTDLSNTLTVKIDEANTIEETISTSVDEANTNKDLLIAANSSATHTLDLLNDAIENGDLNSFLSTANIVNDLTETVDETKVLSAIQGNVLKGYIDSINTLLTSDNTSLDDLQEIVDFITINKSTLDSLGINSIAGLQAALDAKQPTLISGSNIKTINNIPLLGSGNIETPESSLNTFTADEDIVAGDKVAINSNGNVELITDISVNINQTINVDAYYTAQKTIYIESLGVIAYIAENNAQNTCYVYIGTITNDVVTFGSGNLIASGIVNQVDISWNANQSCLICAYNVYDDLTYIRVGTISGTTVSFGSAIQLEDDYRPFGLVSKDGTNNFLAWTSRSSSSTNSGIYAGTVDGVNKTVSLSVRTELAGLDGGVQMKYDVDNAMFLLISSSGNIKNVVTNGTTISSSGELLAGLSSIETINIGNVSNPTTNKPFLIYDEINKQYGVLRYGYTDANSNYFKDVYITFFTLSGSTITYESTKCIYSGVAIRSSNIEIAHDKVTNSFIVFMETNSSPNEFLYIRGSIAGVGTISVEQTFTVINPNDVGNISTPIYLTNGLFSVIYDNPSDYQQDFIILSQKASNYHNFIGVASEDITNSNQGKVVTLAGVSDTFSGLTVGTKYYLNTDGSLSTIDTGSYVGLALSATKILIGG